MAYTGAWKTDVVRLRAFEPGEDAGGKERGGRAMHGARPAARKLMQAPRTSPPCGRRESISSRPKGRTRGRIGALREAGDPCAQIVQNNFLPLLQHGFSGALGFAVSFLICSLFPGRVNARGWNAVLRFYVEAKKQEHGRER
jgi:hypothetical protein